jgi:hypothetical protein
MLWDLLASYWFPFLLTVALMLGCYAAAGATLGLFLAGIAVATLVTPAVVLSEETSFGRIVAWAGVVDAILLVWLAPIFSGAISFGDWLEATLVCVAYTGAVAGVALALRRLRMPAAMAAAVTVVLGLGWLSWPVWMAPWLTGDNREMTAAWLVWGHPLFALNGAMLAAFPQPWAQMPVAYRLTNLGDDVAYELPRGIVPCVVAHATLAAMTMVPQFIPRRRRRTVDSARTDA